MKKQPDPFEQALIRGMTQRRISRRDALKYAGVGAGSLSFASLLAACSVGGAKTKACTPAT
ncbi:MAG: twin-arginine translocation signal domain-containing protein [Actinomycetota bacterium]